MSDNFNCFDKGQSITSSIIDRGFSQDVNSCKQVCNVNSNCNAIAYLNLNLGNGKSPCLLLDGIANNGTLNLDTLNDSNIFSRYCLQKDMGLAHPTTVNAISSVNANNNSSGTKSTLEQVLKVVPSIEPEIFNKDFDAILNANLPPSKTESKNYMWMIIIGVILLFLVVIIVGYIIYTNTRPKPFMQRFFN